MFDKRLCHNPTIGAAIGGILTVDGAMRGTGRTENVLDQLQEGDVFITAANDEYGRQVKHMIKGRKGFEIAVYTVKNWQQFHEVVSRQHCDRRIFFDHTAITALMKDQLEEFDRTLNSLSSRKGLKGK